MNSSFQRIVLIGPCPKPLGGVSVHILRLAKLICQDFRISFIDESKEIKPEYYNIYSYNCLKYLLRIVNADIVHIHSGNSLIRNFHIVVSKVFFKKIVVTLHSFTRKKTFSVFIDKLFLKLANKVIVVNKEIEKIVGQQPKVVVQFAFLPPEIATEPEVSDHVLSFINKSKAKGKKIIVGNAWRLDLYKNQDLYGLDMCIQLAKDLVDNKMNVTFVFVVASLDKHQDAFIKYQKEIKDLNLHDSFLLINEELSFSKLITHSDVVIRPTNTDGDALTIREALYFNKPVIASDVIHRPQNTVLFKTRDNTDLLAKTLEVLSNPDKYKSNLEQIDYKSIYLNIYKECAE